jgi:flagella basal body P-ring formation protein FlgA
MFAIDLILGNKILRLMRLLTIIFILSPALTSIAKAIPANKSSSTNSISVNSNQTVELKSSVIVDEAYILLGDLFTNTGGRSAIKVAYAPQAGKKSQFDAKWLYRIARAYKLNWRPLSLKTRVFVERSSQVIYRDEIEDILVERLRSQGYKDNFEIEFGQREPTIYVAANEPATIDIEGLSITKSTGRFIATLVIPANKTNAKRFRLTGRIHRLIQIPVISRRLNRGDIIQKDDIEWINLRERKLRRGYIQAEEEIIGKAAKRYIAAKTPLTASHLRRPQLVKKGSIVNIALIDGAMRLTTQGRSLENGSLGDTIRIKNTRTKRIIEAKVTGASSAKVGLLRATSLN